MSFSETIFLFLLALVIFGPKKLPEIARQAGRLLAELRRASNEFRSQIEQEIAHIETENTQKILPPSQPLPGTVASRSLNASPLQGDPAPPATSDAPPATSDAPPAETTAVVNAADSPSSAPSTAAIAPADSAAASASQESRA
jgi:sec-independent protein translocase protein TatB